MDLDLRRCPPGETAIYGLSAAPGCAFVYIGKSIHPAARLSHHLHRAHHGGPGPLDDWIRGLAGRPHMEVIERVPESEWRDAEEREIARHRTAGAPLLNTHRGGNGSSRGNAPSTGINWLREHSSIPRVRACGKSAARFRITCRQIMVCPVCARSRPDPADAYVVATGDDLARCLDEVAAARVWVSQSRALRKLAASAQVQATPWVSGTGWTVTLAVHWGGPDAALAQRYVASHLPRIVSLNPRRSRFDLLLEAASGDLIAASRWRLFESAVYGRRMLG